MTKNPIMNAVAASAYIGILVFVMNYVTRHIPEKPGVFVPITFLSLFTLSAAVMGYIFVLQPLRMYLDGDKKGGVEFFIRTLGVFGIITIILVTLVFLGVAS